MWARVLPIVALKGGTRELSDSQINEIHQRYSEVHNELERLAKEGSLIIDCHSFPTDLAPDVDICIGFNEDDSTPPAEVLEIVINHFREAGYRVGVNHPYSNAMRVKASIPTFMIEFNKAIYLQDDGKTLSEDYHKKNSILKQLYVKLLED